MPAYLYLAAVGLALALIDLDVKRLPDVLSHHAGTVRVLHTLTPIGVAMAGEREFDPYRD